MIEYFIIGISLILSAFFSGIEIAFISSNKFFFKIEKEEKISFSKRLLKKIVNNPSKFIVCLLFGNSIALVIYGIFMGDLITHLLFVNIESTTYEAILIQTLISTLIILITAEFLPKVLFQIYANSALHIFSLPISFFYYLFYPFTTIIMFFTRLFLKKGVKIEESPYKTVFSKVELGYFIEEQVENIKNPENIDYEIPIFQNALKFSTLKAREIMVPRADIIAIDINTELNEVKNLFIKTGFSKIIVYKENIDNIIGYIHAFEMLKKPTSLKNILLPIEFIPEQILIHDTLNKLIKKRKSLAVVFDEYGGTVGLLTIEDIVEELFGEIEDEYDAIDYIENVIDNSTYEFSARLEIDYLNEKYNLNLPTKTFYDTLGGFIMHHTEKIPKIGEVIKIENFTIEIKKASSSKIELIRINS